MKKNVICFILLILVTQTFAQNIKNLGVPYVQNYLAEDYHAHDQNWAALQTNDGLMYFANTLGLLEFDGKTWHFMELPNKDIVRSLHQSNDGRLYVGGINELGYYEPDPTGQNTYHSLLSEIPEDKQNFYDVWRIIEIDGKILMQTSSYLFFFQQDKLVKTIETDTRFHRLFFINNRMYLREVDKGLFTLQNDSLVLIKSGELFANVRLYAFLPFDQKSFVCATIDKGLFLFDGEKLSPWKTSIDDILISSDLYCGVALDTSYFIFGSTKGIFVFDREAKLVQFIDKERGMAASDILNLYLDREKNLWAMLGAGISRIEINSPYSYYNKNCGFDVKCYVAFHDDNQFYTGGEPAIFNLDFAKDNNPLTSKPFVQIPTDALQTWEIKKYDNRIFCLQTPDLCIVEGKKITRINIDEGATYKMLPVHNNNNALLIGKDDGIYVLEKQNKEWTYTKKVAGFEETARWLEYDSKGNYWASIYGQRIFRFNINNSLDSVYNLTSYDLAPGYPLDIGNRLTIIGNDLVVATDKGFYFFNYAKNAFEPYEKINRYVVKDKPVNIAGFDAQRIWFTDNEGIGLLKKNDTNGYQLIRTPFFKFEKPTISYSIYAINDSNIIFNQSKGFVHYNSLHKKDYNQSFNTLIRKVELTNNDSVVYGGFGKINNTVQLNYQNNSLRFVFAAPFYENSDRNEYQYQLEGFDREWSAWSDDWKKEYTALPEGTYTFKVRSRNVFRTQGNEATFVFNISAPWYRTWWAYIIYITTAIALVYFIVQLNLKRLKIANQRLEKTVNERTAEIRHKNSILEQQKEEIQAQAEQLETTNKELEKLSIVASETDNSVIIMDAAANFEWVNAGFVRLYGYSMQNFVQLKGSRNLLSISSDHNVQQYIQQCIKQKEPVIYESFTVKPDGEKIWLQTTLTPYLDGNNNINKLIAIESNIGKLKQAEHEIRQQSEEIAAQRDALEERNKEIAMQNEHIKASIRYALTIQKAILPLKETLTNYLDYFVLYKPKDIVSGDFYWFSVITDNATTKSLMLVVADCTGHGVPGAFMSMIGSRVLNEIVNEHRISQPSEILELLDEGIRKSLKQEYTENNDGMDIGIVRIDINEQQTTVVYSGAKRPLFVYKNVENQIQTHKGSHRSIGGARKTKLLDQTFEQLSITIQKGDVIYLSSDGFVDQPNKERHKFGTPKFTDVLLSIAKQDTANQYQILENALFEHTNNEPQRDDITVWGVKF